MAFVCVNGPSIEIEAQISWGEIHYIDLYSLMTFFSYLLLYESQIVSKQKKEF